jgi:predicted transposase/invertase (TIGR01784 family)
MPQGGYGMKESEVMHLFDDDILREAEKAVAEGRQLSPTSDVVFKSLFAKETPESQKALAGFLSGVLDSPVTQVRVLNPEILPEFITAKTVRLDVHCTFNNGQSADIEMQMGRQHDDKKLRCLVYACKMGGGQLPSGEPYKNLLPFYQIMLTNFLLFPETEEFHITLMPRHETLDIVIPHMQMHFLELPKLAKVLSEVERDGAAIKGLRKSAKWGIFLKYRSDLKKQALIQNICESEEGIMHAQAVLGTMSMTREEWAKELFRQKTEHDYLSGMTCARYEGFDSGFEQGIGKGIEQERAESLQRENQSKLNIARNMKANGLRDDVIIRYTGLSADEMRLL